MVKRYEHASHERDAVLANALNPFTGGGIVIPFDQEIAHVAHTPWVNQRVRFYPYQR